MYGKLQSMLQWGQNFRFLALIITTLCFTVYTTTGCSNEGEFTKSVDTATAQTSKAIPGDLLTNKQTSKQTNKQTNKKQTNKQTSHIPVILLVNLDHSVYNGDVSTLDSEDSHISYPHWFWVVCQEEQVTSVVSWLKFTSVNQKSGLFFSWKVLKPRERNKKVHNSKMSSSKKYRRYSKLKMEAGLVPA